MSSGLLAMAIKSLGYEAVSFQGHQVRIITDNAFSRARILKIDDDKIKKTLSEGKIVIVAGFQGVNEEGDVTTLGRGGSDLTAVALAAVLGASVCELHKDDVDGVYTTDPGICASARKLKRVSYDEMLEMASLGSKVLQARAVQLAKKYRVRVHVCPTGRSEGEGTWVMEDADMEMEDVVVAGVTHDKNQAKITVVQVPDRPGIAAKLFTQIGEEGIVVDMIVQNVSTKGYTDMTFTVPRTDLKKALRITEEIAGELGGKGVIPNDRIAKVSIVGVGMSTHAGVASRMFSSLAKEGINIMMISTSEIKVSCIIDEKYTELAVRALHDAFNLGEEK